ncbi:hypothetical protein [Rickettsia endosymbiont of Polydrusus tereticollis]|uniref:hypothetical protein n=1 Tax=Rickettsia endosymbiont of Polydrusus tereticollis TaxID=3066251 RepID=UPI0031331DDF
MNKPNKKEDNQIFGRIFTEMSRAELGLGKVAEALEHARKAKTIFINDPIRYNNNIITSPDVDLAKAFVVEGDVLAVLNKNEEAVKSYATAENIYWNNYRENMKNVDEISIMYLDAVKASCGVPKDSDIPQKFWHKKFRNHHIEKFGGDHPRSIEILNLKCHNPGH